MAHDLRAPLRAMQGFSRALLDEFEAGFPPEARDYFRRIMSAAERMDRLINDLLQFVRVSGSPVAPVPVNPRDVLMNVLRDVNSNIHQAGATVDVQVSEEPVLATEMLLQQIFTNFVTNGLKFVRPGVPPRLTIRSEPVDDGTRILFEDNGIGIAIEHQHRIFQLFQRLHTEAEFAGTGIGLAFVKQAAERIGAEVGMSSEAGAGSKFWIDLQRPAEKSAGQGG
jgi:signal transduction histidine kinase